MGGVGELDSTDGGRWVGYSALWYYILTYYSATGCLSRREWEELGNWTVRMAQTADGLGIAPSGVAELFEMGQRTRQRFPRLFNSMTHPSQVEVRCTGFERAKANSANFLHGLFGLKGRS